MTIDQWWRKYPSPDATNQPLNQKRKSKPWQSGKMITINRNGTGRQSDSFTAMNKQCKVSLSDEFYSGSRLMISVAQWKNGE